MRNSLNVKYAIVGQFDETIIEFVEATANLTFEQHDSLYKGDYWLAKMEVPELVVELRVNIDPLHDPHSDPAEEYYFDSENRDCTLLLDISGDPHAVKSCSAKLAGHPKFRLIPSENHSW